MKFIVLVGKDRKGKTTTLKTVIYKLLVEQYRIIDDPNGHRLKTYVRTANDVFVPKNYDLTVLLENSNKKTRIGITSYGDLESVLRNKVKFFTKAKCDCIICAAHPTGTSAAYIQDLEKDPCNQICKVQKIGCCGDDKDWKYSNLCDFSDSLTANEIISYI